MSNPTEGERTYIVVLRHPDYSNEYVVDGDANVEVIDVDQGADDLTHRAEFLMWAQTHLAIYDEIPEDEYDDARDAIANAIVNWARDYHDMNELPDVREAILNEIACPDCKGTGTCEYDGNPCYTCNGSGQR